MDKNKSQNGNVITIIVIMVAVLMVGGLGYIAWNNFFRTSANDTQKTETEQPPVSNVKEDIKTTLPNGKSVTYPDTESNRNITFRNAENGDSSTPYVFISHQGYAEYLASLGKSKVDALCGPDDNLKATKENIVFGLFNTSDRAITPPQNENCVELIASTEDSDSTLRASAQKVLDTITSDVSAFVASVTIE